MSAVAQSPRVPSLHCYAASSAALHDLPRPMGFSSHPRLYCPPAQEVKLSAARAFCVWATTPIDVPALVLGTLRSISHLLVSVKERCTASRPCQSQASQYIPAPRAPNTPIDICFEQFEEVAKKLSPAELEILIEVLGEPSLQTYVEVRIGDAQSLVQGVMAIVENIKGYRDFIEELRRVHPAPVIAHIFARYHLKGAYEKGIFALPDRIKACVRSDCEKMRLAHPLIVANGRALLQTFQGRWEDTVCNLGEDVGVIFEWSRTNSEIASFWNEERALATGSFQTHDAQMSPQKFQLVHEHLFFQLEFQNFCQIVGQKKILLDSHRMLFNEISFLHQIQDLTKEGLKEKLSLLPADSSDRKHLQELLQKAESTQTEPQVLIQRRMNQIRAALPALMERIQALTEAAAEKKAFFARTKALTTAQITLLEAQNLLEEVKNVRAIDETHLAGLIANVTLIDDFGRLNAVISQPDFMENWQKINEIVVEIKRKASLAITTKLDAAFEAFLDGWDMPRLPAHVAAHRAGCIDRFRAALKQIQDDLELNRDQMQGELADAIHRTKESLALAKSRAIEHLTPRQFQESQKTWLEARMLELRPLLRSSNPDAVREWLDCQKTLTYLQIFEGRYGTHKENDDWAPTFVASQVPEREAQYACLLEGQVFGRSSDAKILVIDGTKHANNWQWRMAKTSLTPDKIRALCGNMSANESKWLKADQGSFVLSDAREGTVQISSHKPSDFWTPPPQTRGLASVWSGLRNLVGSTNVRSKELERVASVTLIKHMAQVGLQGKFNQLTHQDLHNVRYTLSALDENREFSERHARDEGFQQMRTLFREGLGGDLIPLTRVLEEGSRLQDLSRQADQRDPSELISPFKWD